MRAYWRVDGCGRQAILEALRTKLAEVCALAEGAREKIASGGRWFTDSSTASLAHPNRFCRTGVRRAVPT
jgi:hypothetical protein